MNEDICNEELFWEKEDEVVSINPEDLIKAAEKVAAIPNLEPIIDTLPIQIDVIDYNAAHVMEDEEVSSLVEMINKLDKKYVPKWSDLSGVSGEPELFTIGMHSSYFPMEIEEDKLVLVGVSNSN